MDKNGVLRRGWVDSSGRRETHRELLTSPKNKSPHLALLSSFPSLHARTHSRPQPIKKKQRQKGKQLKTEIGRNNKVMRGASRSSMMALQIFAAAPPHLSGEGSAKRVSFSCFLSFSFSASITFLFLFSLSLASRSDALCSFDATLICSFSLLTSCIFYASLVHTRLFLVYPST